MVEEGRTRRRNQSSRKQPSAAHYVGYVDDEESVESILKKFEELEKIQAQVKGPKDDEDEDDKGKAPAKDEDDALTEEQLEEVFKRTSMFSAKILTGKHTKACSSALLPSGDRS
jgi:hypothetical protein